MSLLINDMDIVDKKKIVMKMRLVAFVFVDMVCIDERLFSLTVYQLRKEISWTFSPDSVGHDPNVMALFYYLC